MNHEAVSHRVEIHPNESNILTQKMFFPNLPILMALFDSLFYGFPGLSPWFMAKHPPKENSPVNLKTCHVRKGGISAWMMCGKNEDHYC